jgi:hypothetical protein
LGKKVCHYGKLILADGLGLAEGDVEAEGLYEALDEADAEAEGLCEADGDRDEELEADALADGD